MVLKGILRCIGLSSSYHDLTSLLLPPDVAVTQMELLDKIAEWVCDPYREQIYILAGIAGKGKSTVAKTVALRAAQQAVLGASFFFSRHKNELNMAKKFFAMIAFQLAQYHVDFMNTIRDALDSFPDAPSKALHDQLPMLILDPLGALCPKGASLTVIVIDTLDKCQESELATIL